MSATLARPVATLLWESTLPLLADLLSDPDDWRSRGACVGADPELFSPPGEDERIRGYPPRAVQAAGFCHGCPVREECRDWADRRREVGVWGGSWRNGIGAHYRSRRVPTEHDRKRPAPKRKAS